MKTAIFSYQNQEWRAHLNNNTLDQSKVTLVTAFGDKATLQPVDFYDRLRSDYPNAEIVLCSTAGEIFDDSVYEGSVSVTAVEFEKTAVHSTMVHISDFGGSSYEAGKALIENLMTAGAPSYVLVLSDGSRVNGSELVKGINSRVQQKVPVTGGLAGDGVAFRSTLVGLNSAPDEGQIAAIGLYGNDIQVSHGSMGGWESFGPERTITRSQGNQLFKIDDESALDLYKKYLGAYAGELPGSALLFPLLVRIPDEGEPVVRTILSIDEESRSMLFAGDVPEGASVRFMKANFDRLVDAASSAAMQTFADEVSDRPSFSILISCVGRKIILGSRVSEEVEAVKDIFGSKALITGFYSYGEIAPSLAFVPCQLHNQTMTITNISER
ncbi:MAG: FIST C-terminal domain-containing protein [Bacteroidetes bacterium]|nr:FIST C-terminal domain-containing protein [Bacteroidota bacterium]